MDLITLEKTPHFEHSRKVSQISGLLAKAAGYGPEQVHIIEQAALFHDVGKSYIPAEILFKPGKLTESEFAIVKQHTVLGHQQIKDTLRVLAIADAMANYHHEKYDGTGYHGLSGEGIPLDARLVAVADVFDALFSKRVYKDAWSVDDVLKYMEENAGTQFDKDFIKLLLLQISEILELYHA